MAKLEYDIKRGGYWDADLVKFLENILAIVNELQTDHATYRANLVALYAQMDADAGTLGTDYVATLGASGSGDALPATLTNSTALSLNAG